MFNQNHRMFFRTLISFLLLGSFMFADPTDGCELNTNQLFLTSDGDVLYNSNTDIGGFQWNVDGTTVSGASGGAAADAGFTVSAGGSTVLGFSFTGASIPAGCGVLTSLNLDGEATGLSGIVISDPSAQSVPFTYWTEGDGGGSDGVVDDGCDLPANNLYLMDGDVLYNSSDAIGGFQFNVDGATASSASGGAAADAGFTVSTGGSVVLGFSFTGSSIPSGCGTLTSLVLDGDATGLSGPPSESSGSAPPEFLNKPSVPMAPNQKRQPVIVDKKIGRNDKVTIQKGTETKTIKYKKAEQFINDGWQIIDPS